MPTASGLRMLRSVKPKIRNIRSVDSHDADCGHIQRVAHLERYVRLLKSKPEIILRAPMVHVASFLQMTPETLSRVRSAYVD